jgi:hypothetical protein
LLDPASGLQRVVMEDLTPDPPEGVDPTLLLAADLAEYYGGRDLASAERVVVSQLKYSSRHPDQNWTAARLAEKGSRGQKGVVARLADLYLGVSEGQPRDQVLKRLEIRLVSNRPASETLRDAVDQAHTFLSAHPQPVTRADLLRSLSATSRGEIERLDKAAGLTSKNFTDFLRVLDLGYTGEESNAEQELRVTQGLYEHVMAELRHASLALAELVRKRGEPNSNGVIEFADVLVALEVTEDELLPAPAKFNPPEQRVRTPDAARLAAALRERRGRRLLAHGDAGVGKTTTILSLEKELPPGSVVLAYDCFGDGDYDTPAAGRHDPIRFALQLCNQLASRCRLPILLKPSRSVHTLWGELERRLEAAGALLAEQGAQLVVVVDAADNSARAARIFKEDTFLRRLWAQPIPENVSLVLTCRTARRDEVEPPESVPQLELSGFDEAASAALLRTRFPDAPDEAAAEFHRRSNGIPRMQFYVLSAGPADVASAVEQAAKTPNDLFGDLLDAAVAQAPDPEAAAERLAELVCLTKPLTTQRFRSVSGMAAARVRAFCRELVPGVVIEGDVIAFRDEDFANFLRSRVGDQDEVRAHARLADLFLSQLDDSYAASVVADHLHNAARGDDLLALALSGPPQAIPDGLPRQQTFRRRLTLAMRHAADVSNRLGACQLVILAAEAARQDQAVSQILRRRPDLGMRYSDPEAVMRVYAGSETDWKGPVHMQLAGFFARAGDRRRAAREASMVEAWLKRWRDQDEDWRLEPDDVAAYAEAWFVVGGAQKAERQIRRWQPERFALNAGVALTRRLSGLVDPEELGLLIADLDLPAVANARLMAAAYARGSVASAVAVRRVAEAVVAERPAIGIKDAVWTADFVELAAQVGLGKRRQLRLLRVLALPQPTHAPHRHDGLGHYYPLLRMAALRAQLQAKELKLDDLMPLSVTNPREDARHSSVESEKRSMYDAVQRFVAISTTRARALLERPEVQTLRDEWLSKLVPDAEGSSGYRREPDFHFRIFVEHFTVALLACEGTDTELVGLVADRAAEAAGRGAYASWLTAAGLLARDARYREQALKLLDRTADEVEAAEWPASEKAGELLKACAIADPIDPEQARDLHARAIRAAEGIDDEGIGRLRTHARIAQELAGSPQAPQLAWRTAEALVAHRLRVSDDDYLPWSDTVQAVARMHPATGLALISRWADDTHMPLSHSVGRVVLPAVQAELISPWEGLNLMRLGGENGFPVDSATTLLERLAPGPQRSEALSQLSLWIRRDQLPDSRSGCAKTLIEWAEAHDLGTAEAVELLRPYVNPPAPPSPTPVSRPWSGSETETEWDRQRRQADEVLARAATATPDVLSNDLAELARLYGADRIPRYLRAAADAQVPSRRVAFLDVLGGLAPDHPVCELHGDDVLAELVYAAQRWSGSQRVRQRAAPAVERFFETHLEWLTRSPDMTERALGSVLGLELLQDPAALVLRAVGRLLDVLEASLLFAVASQLANALGPEDRAELLDWSLAGVEAETVAVPELPEAGAAVLAGVLWTLLGAPDKAIRWRAAHAARAIITKDGAALGEALLDKARQRSAVPFGSDRSPFHWLSAQMWTLMTLARAAGDAPAVMTGLAARMATMAQDRQWPHAAVREFARRGALRIAGGVPGQVDDATVAALRLANRPLLYKCAREDWFHRTGSGHRNYDTERFHFDSMDTLPYVYGPFGKRFGLTVDEVAERAEGWIIDRLGLTDLRIDDPRLQAMDFTARHNRHGSSPRGEDWRQMLEEHALQLVAGELCDENREIAAEMGDPASDPWQDWLAGWTDQLEDGWIVDYRDPVAPNNTLLLRDLRDHDWPELTETEVRRAVAAGDPHALIVDANVQLNSSFGWGHTYVTSALVAPDAAPALVRALDAEEKAFGFSLPEEEGSGHGYQDNIDDGEFRLTGWTRDDSGHDEAGLEEHDPLRRISARATRPGAKFLEICGGTVERGGKFVRGEKGELLAWERSWNDVDPQADHYREPTGSRGSETYVRRDALRDFLAATDSMLIIKVSALRRKSAREYVSEENTSEQSFHRIYLYSADGQLV